MRRLASADTEHRRGMVLGLTMAEVLLLLLFLLMLALTHALVMRDRSLADRDRDLLQAQDRARLAEQELEALRPVREAVQRSGVLREEDARRIGQRLARLDLLEREASQLRSEIREANEALQQFRDIVVEARRIDPDAPPAATLQKALRQAAELRAGPVTSSMPSSLIRQLEAAARTIAPDLPPAATLQRGLDGLVRTGSLTDVVVAVRDTERRLGNHLGREFASDLSRWGATFDASALTIRFGNPDVLFKQGNAELEPAFRQLLTEFFPRYLASLREFRDDIQEVRIEGHTSSDWGVVGPLDAYFLNMALSQARTRTVLDFGLTRTAIPPDMRDWARSLITANGLSSSRLRLRPDGTEDREASRRVEFRVVMKLRENVMKVVDGQR
jgi:outer membrane protein OmpA-like peptidoglycan-associated protein